MDEPDLDALRDRLQELEIDDPEIEPVARAILSRQPDYEPATNALGRRLLDAGEPEEALVVFEAGLAANPDHRIARERIARIRHELVRRRVLRRAQDARPRRSPEEIVEPVLAGPHRGACLGILAMSILETLRIDRSRLAVTDIPSENRFRVVGGVYSAVAPWRRMLCVSVDKQLGQEVIREVLAAGGAVTDAPPPTSAVPRTVQLGVPFDRVGDFAEALRRPHIEHLKHSIAWGPPTWLRVHDAALQEYLLSEASAAA